MKDLNISVKDQIRELWYLLIAFMISNALNIGAIIYYHSPAIEIVTSMFYAICFSIFLYTAWSMIRIFYYIIKIIILKCFS